MCIFLGVGKWYYQIYHYFLKSFCCSRIIYLYYLNFSGLSSTVHFPGAKHNRSSPQLDRDKELTSNLELGELGQLTITNDNESSYDVSIFV